MKKSDLRKEIRTIKKSYTQDILAQKSNIIIKKLENHPLFQRAKVVMLYASLPDEVQTLDCIAKWQEKKTIILPTIVGNDIVPVESTKHCNLKEGAYHILEPENAPYIGSFDLIVVPGMAFDKQGTRLGRGKGYYDRFLTQHPNTHTIGLCFDFQTLESIPKEPHDIIINEILNDLES